MLAVAVAIAVAVAVAVAVAARILAAQPGSKSRMIPLIGPLLAPKSRRLSRDRDHRNGAGETAVGAEGGAVAQVAQEAQVMQQLSNASYLLCK